MSYAVYTEFLKDLCINTLLDHGYTEEQIKALTDNEIITASAPFIFEQYPIYDETQRTALNTKIIHHFYLREIGAETEERFLFYLNRTMNENMPYFNQLYESAILEYNPLLTINKTITHSGEGSKTNTGTEQNAHTSTNTRTDNLTKNIESTRTDDLEKTMQSTRTDDLSHSTSETRTDNLTQTNAETRTDNLQQTEDSTRTDDLTQTTDSTRTDDLTQTEDSTRTDDLTQNSDSTRTDNLTKTHTTDNDSTANTVSGLLETPQGAVTGLSDAMDIMTGSTTTAAGGYLSNAQIQKGTTSQDITETTHDTGTQETETETTNTGTQRTAGTVENTGTQRTEGTVENTGTQRTAGTITNTGTQGISGTTTNTGTQGTTGTETNTGTQETVGSEANTGTQTTESEETQTGTQQFALTENNTRTDNLLEGTTDEYTETISGYETHPAQLIKEYRELMLNIDMMVIDSLNDCFMKVY